MEVWLKQDDIELRFPVLPKGYELDYPRNNTEANITNFGTVNIIGNRGLATANISSFWPKKKYSFLQYSNVIKPKEFVKLINTMADNPVRYIVTGAGINMLMTIEDFSVSEDGASGDLNYTLSLKEYRIPKVTTEKTTTVSKTSKKVTVKESSRETKKVKSITYVVKKNDTLMAIAKAKTGDSSNYKAIANQNGITNPNKIYIGQKLVIKV